MTATAKATATDYNHSPRLIEGDKVSFDINRNYKVTIKSCSFLDDEEVIKPIKQYIIESSHLLHTQKMPNSIFLKLAVLIGMSKCSAGFPRRFTFASKYKKNDRTGKEHLTIFIKKLQ